jgi:hypothetical protein
MRTIHRTIIIGLTALASGCATKEQTTTYWTEKSGIVVVHHVVGKVDSIETLSEKPLTSDEAAASDLPKGKYFKVVESHVDAPAKPSKASDAKPTKEAKKDSDGPKLAQVTGQIQDLRREIASVVAQNQRLQDQINNASTQQPVQQGPQPQTAQDNPDAPKLSQ